MKKDSPTPEEKLREMEDRFAFISEVLNAEENRNPHYVKFCQVLEEQYIAFANSSSTLNEEAVAYRELENVKNKLRFLSLQDSLLNRSVISVAGSFSSGKSSFLNSFFNTKEAKLPIGVKRTTAIPSYVVPGNQLKIIGYSYKHGKVNISKEHFSLFSIEKMQETAFNMKNIIRQLVFKIEFVEDFKHLCFIDTPGFLAGKETVSDEEAAMNSIAASSAMIWCFNIEMGTINQSEMALLTKITEKYPDLPIYVIANKADLKSIDECQEVLAITESMLDENGINVEGIALYSSTQKYSEQYSQYKDLTIGIPLEIFLKNFNKRNDREEKVLMEEVKSVFNRYIIADEQNIDLLRQKAKMLANIEHQISEIQTKQDEIKSVLHQYIDQRYYSRAEKDIDNINRRYCTEEEVDSDYEDLLNDLKRDLKQGIDKGQKNIEQAKDLSYHLCLCIAQIFGHALSYHEFYGKKEACAALESGGETNTESTTDIVSESNRITETTARFCTACGKKLREGSVFCTYCGKKTKRS